MEDLPEELNGGMLRPVLAFVHRALWAGQGGRPGGYAKGVGVTPR